MRFALVDNKKVKASPKLRGECTNCAAEMIARCGRIKVWHWAHKSRTHCDHWWESETEWHRMWKDEFPAEWQEISHSDTTTGEKHIADVKNPFGLVIEFQHSPMSYEERSSREEFYKQLVWVVDGRAELGTFLVGRSGPIQYDPLAYRLEWWGKSRLVPSWSDAQVPVYFDLGDDAVWRLVLFDKEKRVSVIGPVAKKAFIEDCHNGTSFRVTVGDPADKRLSTILNRLER